uniref:hypothetical protein n=1 Tax=Allosalinactinospora lopnorensis TaxID=1352348 RepID=UPI000623C512
MAGLAILSMWFSTPLLIAKPPGVPVLFSLGFLGSLGTVGLLYLLLLRSGAPAVMVALTGIALVHLLLSPLSLWAVAVCGVWFAVYGVLVATNRFCGSRAPAGDDVLAAVRARLPDGDEWNYDLALRAVALLGLPQVRELAR